MAAIAEIRAAGDYLLSVLQVEKVVPYSRFYSHDAGTNVRLADGIWLFLEAQPAVARGELDESDRRDLLEEGHLHVEWAAQQLEDLGVVRITFTDAKLADGEPDFLIELTERGGRFIRDGESFRFHSVRSGFDASQASRWLIDVAYHNSDVAVDFRFDIVGQVGYTDGDVKVTDDGGNTYPPGTRPYEWAFEVSLWHHVRLGHVALVFATAEQQRYWDAFMARYPSHLFQHDDFPALLRDVSYRLTPAATADPSTVRHVGWIGRE